MASSSAAGLLAMSILALWRRRTRRVIARATIAALVLFVFETGVHSVHHVADPGSTATCPLLSASHHFSAASAEALELSSPPLAEVQSDPATSEGSLPARFLRPDQGRAPPATPSV